VALCVVIPCVAGNDQNCEDRFAFSRELTPDVGVRMKEPRQPFGADRFVDSRGPISRDITSDGAVRRQVARRQDCDDDAVLVSPIAYFAGRRCSDDRNRSDDLCDTAKCRTQIVSARRIHEDKRQWLQLDTRQGRFCRLGRRRERVLARGATATNLDLRAQTSESPRLQRCGIVWDCLAIAHRPSNGRCRNVEGHAGIISTELTA
jgi:hypothetical protein